MNYYDYEKTIEIQVPLEVWVSNNIDKNQICKNKPFYDFIKRFFDIVLSLLALIILSPIILILLLIKFLEDGRNPIYTSKRVGKGGKIIKFHKIRSMRVGAEFEKKELKISGYNETDGPAFKMKNDPRITKFGRFLRKYSLDELLQIWDIFMGRLSIVGPRPPIQSEVLHYSPYQLHRLDVKGGLLCIWQVHKNRHDLSFNEWVNLDIEYIKKRSLWFDFTIICKGFIAFLTDHSGE